MNIKRLKPVIHCLSTNKKPSSKSKRRSVKGNGSFYGNSQNFEQSCGGGFERVKSARKAPTSCSMYSDFTLSASAAPPESARLASDNSALLQELKNTKKSMIELQGRNVSNTKEIARLQHELNLLGIKYASLKEKNEELIKNEAGKEGCIKELQYEKSCLLKENESLHAEIAKASSGSLSIVLECSEQIKTDLVILEKDKHNNKSILAALKNLKDTAAALGSLVADSKLLAKPYEEYRKELQSAIGTEHKELLDKIRSLEISKKRKSQQIAKYKEEVGKMRGYFSAMRIKLKEVEENPENNEINGCIKGLEEKVEEYKKKAETKEIECKKLIDEVANLKETVSSQNHVIADLQEMLLNRQGVDMPSEVLSSQANDSLQCYLFNEHQ